MKRFSILLVMFLVLVLVGCKKNSVVKAKEPLWDKDTCANCAMQLSDKYHSAEIINPNDGSVMFFDDLGCAVVWLNESNKAWKDGAVIFVNDAKSGEWLNVKSDKTFFAKPYITPMSYGVSVFKNKSDIINDKSILTFDEAQSSIMAIREARKASENDMPMDMGDMKGGM